MLRTTLVDGVRIHTLWTAKDTADMGDTVMRGAAMMHGTIRVQAHNTEGYASVEYRVITGLGEDDASRDNTDLQEAIESAGGIVEKYIYNGVVHYAFDEADSFGGLVALEVHKTIGDGVDPEPELIGIDQLSGLNTNTKRVMEDASGFGLGGRAKYVDFWTKLSWANGSGFFTARQDETSGQYLMGTHTVHGTGDYSFSVMGRKDLVVFQTRENGAKAVQYVAYHSGNVEKLVDAIISNPVALEKLKAAIA